MAISAIADSIRSTMCNAMVDDIDAGTGNGKIRYYTTSELTLLAECVFGATAFGAATAGSATANSITDDTSADAAGTCTVCVITRSDNTVCWKGSVGTTGADINFNTNVWSAGDTISTTALTVTVPAS